MKKTCGNCINFKHEDVFGNGICYHYDTFVNCSTKKCRRYENKELENIIKEKIIGLGFTYSGIIDIRNQTKEYIKKINHDKLGEVMFKAYSFSSFYNDKSCPMNDLYGIGSPNCIYLMGWFYHPIQKYLHTSINVIENTNQLYMN